MEFNINIEEFYKEFNKQYDFLYNAKSYVVGYNEALEVGDAFIKKHSNFIREFNKYRGDILSSDREVVAFIFALDKMCKGERYNESSNRNWIYLFNRLVRDPI